MSSNCQESIVDFNKEISTKLKNKKSYFWIEDLFGLPNEERPRVDLQRLIQGQIFLRDLEVEVEFRIDRFEPHFVCGHHTYTEANPGGYDRRHLSSGQVMDTICTGK